MILSDIPDKLNSINIQVAKGSTRRALEIAADISHILEDKDLRNIASNLLSKFHLNENEYNIKGVISYDDYMRHCLKSNVSVLEFKKELHEKYLISLKATHSNKIEYNKLNSKSIFKGKNITKNFPDFQLKNINLELNNGTILGLIGTNGCGKSTLLNIIAGRTPIDNGELIYLDFPDNNWYNIKGSISYVSQFFPKWEWDIKKTLKYFSIIRGGYSKDESDFEVNYLISRLGLEHIAHKQWEQLSGGQKAKLELARALICRPKLLLMDEPLAHVDPKHQIDFMQQVKDISQLGDNAPSIVITSHHIDALELITDDVLFLENGSVKYYGKTDLISSEFEHYEMDIICDKNLSEVSAILTTLNKRILMRQNGKYFKISTPSDINPNKVMSYLLEKGVVIHQFNDLTNSSKRFFDEV